MKTILPIDNENIIDATLLPNFTETNFNQLKFNYDQEHGKIVLCDRHTNVPFGNNTQLFSDSLTQQVNFPKEFVSTLQPEIQTLVFNNILVNNDKDKALKIQTIGNNVVGIVPTYRPILHPSDILQKATNLGKYLGGYDAVITNRVIDNSGISFLLDTKMEQPITRKSGDIVSVGFMVKYVYGTELSLGLYLKRLVCLNGATTIKNEMSWKQRTAIDELSQLDFLETAFIQGVETYIETIEKLRLMAETPIIGNVETVLQNRARSMGLTQNQHSDLIRAYNQEPGNTEYDAWNAFTRYATYTAGGDQRIEVMNRAGAYAQNYEMVTAVTNRSNALKIGARILTVGVDNNE